MIKSSCTCERASVALTKLPGGRWHMGLTRKERDRAEMSQSRPVISREAIR